MYLGLSQGASRGASRQFQSTAKLPANTEWPLEVAANGLNGHSTNDVFKLDLKLSDLTLLSCDLVNWHACQGHDVSPLHDQMYVAHACDSVQAEWDFNRCTSVRMRWNKHICNEMQCSTQEHDSSTQKHERRETAMSGSNSMAIWLASNLCHTMLAALQCLAQSGSLPAIHWRQSLSTLSLPPEATDAPSGLQSTVKTSSAWPGRSKRSLRE